MSKEKDNKGKDSKRESKVKYMVEVKNKTLLSWKIFTPWVHNIEKWVYDVFKWAKHPNVKVFIKR